jgi:hypothetical protein
MSRLLPTAAFLAVLGTLTGAARLSAADPPAGSWKLTVRADRQPVLMLLNFAQADGKWVGDYIDATARFQQDPKVTDVVVAGDSLKFALTVGGQPMLTFDGVVAKDGKKITGSVSQAGGPLSLTDLRPSSLKKLADPFEIMREQFAQTDDAEGAFDAAVVVLGQAAAKKMKPEDVRGIVDKVAKLAAGYGGRWERTVALRLAGLLADQAGFEDTALAQARRAERMLTDDTDALVRLEVLETLARILTKTNKAAEAKPYLAQIAKLEARDYQEYARTNPAFKPEEFKGRKGKSDRVVLVELFSGSEFAPGAAFDLAGDALLRTYKPTDVIVLSNHVHLQGGGDPLANKDTLDRAGFYIDAIRRGAFAFVAGKPGPRLKETTTAASAKEIYAALREQIGEQLEKPAGVKLTLTVAPGEKGAFAVKAVYADLEGPAERVMLRFAVVEERVRYAGGNGVRYHHNVVRGMPGGAKGFPIKGKAGEQAVTVSPDQLRAELTKYLDEFAKEAEFARPDRPVGLKNLKVVAFVQNDGTNEVLTAAQVELEGKKE